MAEAKSQPQSVKYTLFLTMGALGVVYGDIGTSPLYALRECFSGAHAIPLTPANILGILSLITWSLIIVISIKYVLFVMKADNKGEGGVLALMALTQSPTRRFPKSSKLVVLLGLFGAALLYGDGMITPAISVLSAVEGLAVASPVFEEYVRLVAILILILLFIPQSRGTGRIGIVFGPVIFIWFLILLILGIINISKNWDIIQAINPLYAVDFFTRNKLHAFTALGAVFLAVTGGEALYADMGHFGRKPIKLGWFCVVLPALLFNYFGQGSLLLSEPSSIVNPFYKMAPTWALFPLIGLATLASVIASQALISGAFSLTRQAIQLGYLPRTQIQHTSQKEIGQIYSPLVNWILLVATIFLVLFFKSSSSLAAAYGIAVTLTMLITTILMSYVTRFLWRWSRARSLIVTALLLVVDSAFLFANTNKLLEGGWFPLLIGGMIFATMTTWRRGRSILAQRLREKLVPLSVYLDNLEKQEIMRVRGCAIFMTSNIGLTPPALIHNVKHNKVVHARVILLTVETAEIPYINGEGRFEFKPHKMNFYQLTIRVGFMENPDIYQFLLQSIGEDCDFEFNDVTFFIGRETLIATSSPGMALWREKLFAFLARNAQRATTYFHIPSKDVIEIGMQVDL